MDPGDISYELGTYYDNFVVNFFYFPNIYWLKLQAKERLGKLLVK